MPHWSKFIPLFVFLLGANLNAALNTKWQALELLSQKKTLIDLSSHPEKKADVFIFMSAKCPCSNSHVPLIKDLAMKYPDFRFFAVHSNLDEDSKTTQEYFKKISLPFTVLQDQETQIADQFKAFKTPHAFIVNKKGEILYQGGVTNSSHADRADRIFLNEALEDIHNNRAVKNSEGRTLGCVIMRKNELPQ
jgi:peroxiredoxin